MITEVARLLSLIAGDEDISAKIQKAINITFINGQSGLKLTSDIELDDSDGALMMPKRGEILTLHLGWQGEPYSCAAFYG